MGKPVVFMPNVPPTPVQVSVAVLVVEPPASKVPQLMLLGVTCRFAGGCVTMVEMLPWFWMVTVSMTVAAAYAASQAKSTAATAAIFFIGVTFAEAQARQVSLQLGVPWRLWWLSLAPRLTRL